MRDNISNRFYDLQRNIDGELERNRVANEEHIERLTSKGFELQRNFAEKSTQLKEICATWFAKADSRIVENNKKLEQCLAKNDELAALFVAPSTLMDVKMFSMNQLLKEGELTREAQFGRLQGQMQKLINALRDQNDGIVGANKLAFKYLT